MILREIASLISGALEGDGSIEISGVQGIKDAGEGDITFIDSNKYEIILTIQAFHLYISIL